MKKLVFISLIGLLLSSACSPFDVDKSKPGEPIDTVTNLDYSIAGDSIMVNWDLPSSYPEDIVQPVSVFIRTKIDGQDNGTRELADAPDHMVYSPYDSAKEYKFIVKVKGNVDTSDPNVSHERFSLGKTITIK